MDDTSKPPQPGFLRRLLRTIFGGATTPPSSHPRSDATPVDTRLTPFVYIVNADATSGAASETSGPPPGQSSTGSGSSRQPSRPGATTLDLNAANFLPIPRDE